MEALGFVFLVVIGILVLIALVVFVLSIPDINRYRRVRRM